MSESLLTWELGVAQGKYLERQRILGILKKEIISDYDYGFLIELISGVNNASQE